MNKKFWKITCSLLFIAVNVTFKPMGVTALAASKIHFINLASSDSDAILLESNGHFGMVDSGEDNDYPDGSNKKYPLRAGIVKGNGFEREVISYLRSAGVKNLDFYIATHPHSDHIGSADEIIREFAPKRVYIMEYKDSYISTNLHRWDNLYVYDNAIEAALDVGSCVIQNFSTSAPVTPKKGNTGKPSFSFGNMKVQIYNYNPGYKKKKSNDANEFSLGVKVTSNGKSAFLAGDIENTDGDENVLAPQIGHVNVLKMGHHGNKGSNTTGYLRTLSPDIAILTGSYRNMSTDTIETLNAIPGLKLYTTAWYQNIKKAIVVTLGNKITTNLPQNKTFYGCCKETGKITKYVDGTPFGNANPVGWIKADNGWHYFKADGTMATGWLNLDNNWYYMSPSGVMATGWATVNGLRYYFLSNGHMATGFTKIGDKWYYLNSSGEALKGWQNANGNKRYFLSDYSMATGLTKVSGDRYFFKTNGTIRTGFVKVGNKKYYFKDSGVAAKGFMTISSKKYYFKDNGVMVTGFKKIEGYKYYFNSNGVMVKGFKTIDGNKYCFGNDGIMKTGLHMDGNKIYCFAANGVMKVGFISVDGKLYYFSLDGTKKTGWQVISGSKYYFRPDGYAVTGVQVIDNVKYNFDGAGVLKAADGFWY